MKSLKNETLIEFHKQLIRLEKDYLVGEYYGVDSKCISHSRSICFGKTKDDLSEYTYHPDSNITVKEKILSLKNCSDYTLQFVKKTLEEIRDQAVNSPKNKVLSDEYYFRLAGFQLSISPLALRSAFTKLLKDNYTLKQFIELSSDQLNLELKSHRIDVDDFRHSTSNDILLQKLEPSEKAPRRVIHGNTKQDNMFKHPHMVRTAGNRSSHNNVAGIEKSSHQKTFNKEKLLNKLFNICMSNNNGSLNSDTNFSSINASDNEEFTIYDDFCNHDSSSAQSAQRNRNRARK